MLFITGVYQINYVIFQIIVTFSSKIFDLLSHFRKIAWRMYLNVLKFHQRLLEIYVLFLLDRN